MASPASIPSGRCGTASRLPARDRVTDLGWYAVLVFLVAVPATGVWVPVSGHDYSRVMEIALCLVCAVAVAVHRPSTAAKTALVWPTAVIALLALGATVHAPVLPMATRELALLLGLAGLAWLVASRPAPDTPRLLAAVAIAAAAYTALVGLGLAVSLSVANDLRPFDLLIGYDNGRFFNHVQTSMLPLLVLATLQPNRSRWTVRLAWVGLIGGLALLAVSEGRATGLTLCVGAAVGLVLLRASAMAYVRHLAIGVVGAAVVYALLFVALPRLAGLPVEVLHVDGVTDAGSAQSRWVLWTISADGIRRSPWLGIGPMHFSHTWNADAAHPHNVYLQVAEEWGVPMLLLLAGLALVGLRRLHVAVRGCRDPQERTVGTALFITLIGIAVDGLLSGNFVMPVSQVWIVVVFGSAIGWVRRASPVLLIEPGGARRRAWQRALRLLPLIAMLWLAASVAPELELRLFDRAAPGTRTDAGAPRFWSNGWF